MSFSTRSNTDLDLDGRCRPRRLNHPRRCIVGHDGLVQGRWIAFPRRLVSSVVSSNSEGASSLDSRTEVADADGVDCWGSRRIRETLICAGSCSEAVHHVCLEFLFGGRGVIKKVVLQRLLNEHDEQREQRIKPWGIHVVQYIYTK